MMKFNGEIEITNLRGVKRMTDGAFMLTVDLYTPTDGLESVEFCARGDDVAETGKWVYEQIQAGAFAGEITDYVQPTPTTEQVAAQARSRRNSMLAQTDWTQAADVPQATKDKWAPYRQALRDITEQAGFPMNVTWPTKPE